jgi:hypothetical protein
VVAAEAVVALAVPAAVEVGLAVRAALAATVRAAEVNNN